MVGYVSGYRHAAFYAGGDVAWIDEILVSARCRARSIGGLLMAAFEQRTAKTIASWFRLRQPVLVPST